MRYGGVEKALLDILRSINYERYEVDLLLFEGKGEYYNSIPLSVNIIFKDLNNTYGGFASSIIRSLKEKDFLSLYARIIFLICSVLNNNVLLKLLKTPLIGKNDYDFAIAFRTGFCTDVVQYIVNAKKKSTWWHHGEMNLSEKKLKQFEEACNKIKNIVAVSTSTEKMLLKNIPSIKNYLKVIPNMIDVSNINRMALEFNPNFNNKKKHFITACRIAPEKHIENVIFATDLLLKRGFTNFHWHVIGDGEDLVKMEMLSRNTKTENHVIFEGKMKNPYPFIKNADLYIHTSYIESQGLSILESMALNIPCVITDNEGIRDYTNNYNSVVVKQNAGALANAVFELSKDQEKYNFLKMHTKCPDQFSKLNVMEKFYQLVN